MRHRQPLRCPIVLVLADGWGGPDEFALARLQHLSELPRGQHTPIDIAVTPTKHAAYRAILGERHGLAACMIASSGWHTEIAAELAIPCTEPIPSLSAQAAQVHERITAHELIILTTHHIDQAASASHLPGKIEMMERLDAALPLLRPAQPHVLVITGAWCAPANYGRPSWHPVPLFLDAPLASVEELQHLRARDVLPLAIAHADGWQEYDGA